MEIIDKELLDRITNKAELSPRLRMNYNFHESPEAKSQRLLNALEPGTDVPVHRHRHSDETYIIIRGSMEVFLFDDNKELIESVTLNPMEEKHGVNIPAGQWHTLKVLEPGTMIFEVKDGPYTPLQAEDML
ncbi:MAG: WbuC family cupin fold metalloprotein [Paludibacter sp.]|nr:WbuC family cupin fold metalloprotein [Paludibacter sp.]